VTSVSLRIFNETLITSHSVTSETSAVALTIEISSVA